MRTLRTLLTSLTSRSSLVSLVCGAALALPSCAGCSEECSGDNQGAETCPCSSDQDCTTRLGTVLLCVDGACAVEDPPAAPAELGACDTASSDPDQCGAGLGCGLDDICFAAPACQRIDVDLFYRQDDGTTGDVNASLDDCAHTWSVEGGFTATFSIDLEGDLTVEGCDSGHWFAPDRVGELDCDGVVWAIAPADVTTCIGGDCAGDCELVGDVVGVCP